MASRAQRIKPLQPCAFCGKLQPGEYHQECYWKDRALRSERRLQVDEFYLDQQRMLISRAHALLVANNDQSGADHLIATSFVPPDGEIFSLTISGIRAMISSIDSGNIAQWVKEDLPDLRQNLSKLREYG